MIVHICELSKKSREYINSTFVPVNGHSISENGIRLIRGIWIATNDEYSTIISFCPFCGSDLISDLSDLISDLKEDKLK